MPTSARTITRDPEPKSDSGCGGGCSDEKPKASKKSDCGGGCSDDKPKTPSKSDAGCGCGPKKIESSHGDCGCKRPLKIHTCSRPKVEPTIMLPAPHQPGMEVDLMPKMEIVSDYVQDCKDAWPTSGYRAIAFQFFAEGWTEGDGIANFFVQTATENKEEHYVDTAFSVSIRENAGEFTKIVVLNVDSMAEYVRVRVEFTPGFNSSAVVWASLNMLHRENLSTIGDCACDAGEATYDDAYAEGGTGVAHEEPDGEGGRDGDAPKGGADDPDDRSADEDSDGDRSDDDDSGDDPDVENYDGEEGVADDDSDGEGGGFRGEPGCACAIACDKTIERVLFKAATEAKRLEDKDDRLWGTGCRSSGTSIRNSGKNEDSEFHTVDLPPIYVAVVTHGQTAKIEGKISLKDQFPSSKNKASLAQTDSNFDEVEIKDLSQQLSNSFTVSGICGDTFYFKVYPSEIPNKPTNNHQFILTADFGDFICNTLLSAEGYRPNRNPTVARCACSIDPKRIEFNFSTYEALAAGIGLPGVFEPELVHLTLESAGQNHPRPYLITVEPVSNPVTGKDLFSVTPRKFNMYCDTTEPIAVKLTQAGLQLLAQEHIAATFNSGFGRFFGPLMAQEKRDVKIDQAFVVKIAGRECDRFTAHAEMFCDLDQMESEAKSAMMKAVSKPSVKTTYSVGSTGASWKDSASSAKAREASGEAVVAVPSVHSSIEVNTEVDIVFGSEWVAMDCCCVKLESILVSIDVHMQVPETWYSEIGAADFSSDEARSEMKAMFTDWGSNFPKRKKLKQQISSLVVDMLASNLDDLFARAGLPLPGRLPYCSKEPDLNECARMADSLTNAVNSPGMGMEPSEREKLEASVRDIVLGAIGSMKKHKSLDDIKKAKIKAAIEKQVAEQLEKMKQDYDDQMAYWGRNRGTHYFSGYGRYCGPGSLGGEPIDEIDNCCKIHDECYGLGGFDAAKVQAGTLSAAEKRFQLNCDIALCECADSHVKSRRDSQVAYNMCNWFKMDHDSDDWTAWSPNAWAHNESLLRNWPIIVPRLLIKEPD